jgi:hypothetical protein
MAINLLNKPIVTGVQSTKYLLFPGFFPQNDPYWDK